MKNKLLNIICAILIVASLFVIVRSSLSMMKKPSPSSASPRADYKPSDPLTEADFEETLIDVGNLPADTTIHQSYTFRNTGAHPLIVYRVDPDCNCTDYTLSQATAMPNDSIRLTLSVATKNKRPGMFMLHTVVQTNTQKQMYRLRLVGNVVR